jgi:hypothetical protein
MVANPNDFDTLQASEELTAAGMQADMAKTLARLLQRSRAIDVSTLATKQDLEILKRDMTIRLGGMIAVAVDAMAALVKLL